MYTISIPVSLGSSKAGLTLTAQLIDTSGNNSGDLISTGIVEIGSGNYLLTTSIPDGFRGGMKILSGATIMALCAINPEELEFIDVAISSRLSEASAPNTILDEPISDHLVAGSVGEKINSISTGNGSGSVQFTYTVTNGTIPIPNVKVNVSTDSEQINLVATGFTNSFGEVLFYLDPGTYYFWCSKSGYSFVYPDVEVVS